MKINLGISSKRYTRDMSFDNNTTYGFGDVQPLYCQFMLPDSDIKIGMRQLVRPAPLRVPTFGRIHLENNCRFVPMADIWQPFESFLSAIPYSYTSGSTVKSLVPSSLPCTYSNILFLSLLAYCKFSVYSSSGVLLSVSSARLSTLNTSIWTYCFGSQPSGTSFVLSLSNLVSSSSSSISLTGADYVLNFPSPWSDVSGNISVALRLGRKAQMLRKIFIGLGYDVLSSVGLNSSEKLLVNILPLFAFYKAYFETYYPTRDVSFTDTYCYALIDHFNNTDTFTIDNSARYSVIRGYFEKFFNLELSQCIYAMQDDYLSMHTQNLINQNAQSNLSVVGSDPFSFSTSSYDPSTDDKGKLPHPDEVISDYTYFDNVLLKSIKIFTNFVSKDSVIGQRMTDWVRTHFNADIAASIFEQSNFVGRSRLDVNIGDVFSTSDTSQGSGESATGENLGAYAGKGIGSNNSSFRFHSKVHGYLFVFSCIVPESRTYQGFAAPLLATTRFELPQPEFDALGYEVTDKRVLSSNNDIFTPTLDSSSFGFGYVPRYTGFKYNKNIVNGDMSRRSTIDTMSPYFLDRYIQTNSISGSSINHVDLPSASVDWRFLTMHNYGGNYDRIFYNENFTLSDSSASVEMVENFIGQTIFDVSLRDALKPLKSSYDTFDDERDNSTKEVENS